MDEEGNITYTAVWKKVEEVKPTPTPTPTPTPKPTEPIRKPIIDTSDNTNVAGYGLTMIMSMLALALGIFFRRRYDQ